MSATVVFRHDDAFTRSQFLLSCAHAHKSTRNDRVKLVPFVPSEPAEAFYPVAGLHPELFTHVPFGPFASTHTPVGRPAIQRGPFRCSVLFDVTESDTTRCGSLDRSRTHITNNAMGLHFHPTLHARAESGLMLRGVAWKTNSHIARGIPVFAL
ncbi:hypothetical protein K438DRAFT_1981601 [Mycena galopus ATCC 62051]|nr:hypothetical protein K438DRAFT_1981601 [Mycena galopus ATCC 62051]